MANTPAEIILIGGAAILADYGFREATDDMDAIITAPSEMEDAIRAVGDAFNLPDGRVNEDCRKTASGCPRHCVISLSCRRSTRPGAGCC